jgi:hypothetical protein
LGILVVVHRGRRAPGGSDRAGSEDERPDGCSRLTCRRTRWRHGERRVCR